jgi:hypothetical protein
VPELHTRPEATFSPRADEGPGRNLTPVTTVRCPTVGANCHGNLETVAVGMAKRRGSTVCDDGSGSGLCQLRHLGLPRFRALHTRGKTPTSCLVSYYLHSGYNAPRAIRSRGGRRRSDLSSLRVQTPLYMRGSGYRLGGRLFGCQLLHGCVFGVIFWPSSVLV